MKFTAIGFVAGNAGCIDCTKDVLWLPIGRCVAKVTPTVFVPSAGAKAARFIVEPPVTPGVAL